MIGHNKLSCPLEVQFSMLYDHWNNSTTQQKEEQQNYLHSKSAVEILLPALHSNLVKVTVWIIKGNTFISIHISCIYDEFESKAISCKIHVTIKILVPSIFF